MKKDNQLAEVGNKGCASLMGFLGVLVSLVLLLVMSYLLKDDWKGFQIIDEWWIFPVVGFLFGRLMGELITVKSFIEEEGEETEENFGLGGNEIYVQFACCAFGITIPFGILTIFLHYEDPDYLLTVFLRYFTLGCIFLGSLSYLMWIAVGKPKK